MKLNGIRRSAVLRQCGWVLALCCVLPLLPGVATGWSDETPGGAVAHDSGAGEGAQTPAARLAGPTGSSPEDSSSQEGGQASAKANGSAGLTRRQTLLTSLTIFVLAIFVGFEVITKVPPTLHTPLMSGSNAISGITIVGAILVAGTAVGLDGWVGFLAVILAAINVFGGFLVTHRMLAMFKRR